ncbi:non-reducing end alpha-L-arabinofuranosidase family hydrolase [Glycomyces buryatensis]|uniref:non-reducing end alpha-L-arabinofuranosidase n=1 Tax=Glycomyces buryatensis TaxID=2570927 RepID=A0A4S8QD75_9ACTN|nr:non-reducing end alpha-L-arabinofuranosidase family hydrolase [Glycomyces buryatensis]THV42507.1 glycoside hydrolase [Glycomyces buryatensis]
MRTFRSRSRVAIIAGGVAAAFVAATLAATAEEPSADPVQAEQLPSSYEWESTGPLISPQPDAGHDIVSVKDPTVVRYDDQWLVYMTTANTAGGWSMAYTSFSDWSEASSAPQTFLDSSAIGSGYAAAPHVFYFEPGDEWYLVYQTGLPSYSTTDDPTDPTSWSAPQNFQDSMPPIVEENIGNGNWLDFWVTCDDVNCYLFSADDNGHLYRAETTVGEFPNGFDDTQIVLEDTRNNLFEGEGVYKVGDSGTYLLVMEAIGADGRRYFRSFTAEGLDGEWQPLAATEENPFAGSANVGFPDGQWTNDISHGEVVRSGYDQTMEIDPCNLQLLYQGVDPSQTDVEYSQLPYRLGLATATNESC